MAPRVNFPGLFGPGKTLRQFPAVDESPRVSAITPNAGPITGGTAVTITGENFIADGSGSIGVTFDGKPATSIVVVNRRTITCLTPPQITTGVVDIVITVGAKMATLPGAFTYYEIIIVSVVPPHGPLSGGTSVLIAGYNFSLGCSVTFGGAAATDVIFIDTEHIRCTTPAHATGFVDVVVTEA